MNRTSATSESNWIGTGSNCSRWGVTGGTNKWEGPVSGRGNEWVGLVSEWGNEWVELVCLKGDYELAR